VIEECQTELRTAKKWSGRGNARCANRVDDYAAPRSIRAQAARIARDDRLSRLALPEVFGDHARPVETGKRPSVAGLGRPAGN